MTKQEFLSAIANRLQHLPASDVDRALSYYREMIDDRMEDGLSEEDAVAAVGTPEEAVRQILRDRAQDPAETEVWPQTEPAVVPEKRHLSIGVILLLCLGFPLWFPLLITFFSLILTGFILIGVAIIVCFAIVVALAACVVAGFWGGVSLIAQGYALQALIMIGGGILCIGLTILAALIASAVAKALVRLGREFLTWIRRRFHSKKQ